MENEWVIDAIDTGSIQHTTCKIQSRFGAFSEFATRKKEGFYCSWCEEPIPDYILFQWKLLNE